VVGEDGELAEEAYERLARYVARLVRELGASAVSAAIRRLCEPWCGGKPRIEGGELWVEGPFIRIEMRVPPELAQELFGSIDVEELRRRLQSAGSNTDIVDALTRFGRPAPFFDPARCTYLLHCSPWGSGYSCALLDPAGRVVADRFRDVVAKLLKVVSAGADVTYRIIPGSGAVEVCIG